MTAGSPLLAYRADLDGLRAVAVLGVVVFHATPALAPGGYVGVDVFFVLSGYLITALSHRRLQRGTFSLLDFYARRARRLLPALCTVLVATLLAGQLLCDPVDQAALGGAAAAAALFGANLHAYVHTDYFEAALQTLPLLHLWSLGVEEQFYLFAPLGLLALYRRPRLLWGAALATVGLSFVGCWLATGIDGGAAFFLPVFRAWELGLGALLALRAPASLSPQMRTALGVGGIGAIGLAFWLLDDQTPFPGTAALLPTLGALAVLAAGADSPANRVLSAAPLRAIGRWSYAWYLWHHPPLIFWMAAQQRPPTLAEAAALGLGTLALAAASTRWIETPLRSWRMDQPRAAVGVGLLALLACTGLGLSFVGPSGGGAHSGVSPARLGAALARPAGVCQGFTDTGSDGVVCALRDPGAQPDVVVWGDSHAAALAGGLQDAAAARDRQGLVVARNFCPPLLGIERVDRAAGEGCLAHNEAVLAHLERTRPARVVLHARWPLYTEQRFVGPTNWPVPRFVEAGEDGAPADLTRALERTVTHLQGLGTTVVVVGSVPEVGFHVPIALQRQQQVGGAPPEGPPADAVRARGDGARRLLAAVAEGTGATVLHPEDTLCTGERCAVLDGGVPLYLDSNHLSDAGARRLSPVLGALLP